MTDVRLTDERLRSYLNNRQPDRERMCLSILETEPGYSRVEPRRPEGGPDGGRDIQCMYDGRRCFGAVGFKNTANDSVQQVREIMAKFADDLDAAKSADPRPTGFVFFTNVDLTPGDVAQLRKLAHDEGMTSVDVYWRERIRIALDRPEGYAIRHSFLDISLSDAEQKVFFARFGKDLQTLIAGRLDAIEARLEELQFINWSRGTCREIGVKVKLKQLYRVEGHDHKPFRFALRLNQVRVYGQGELLLGFYSVIHQGEKRADYEVKRFVYYDTDLFPNHRKKCTWLNSAVRISGQPFESIEAACEFTVTNVLGQEIGLPLRKLGEYVIDFYCDSSWAEKVDSVEVWYDNYLAYRFVNRGHQDRFDGPTIVHDWPTEAAEVAHLPVQYWHGWSSGLDRVMTRRPLNNQPM